MCNFKVGNGSPICVKYQRIFTNGKIIYVYHWKLITFNWSFHYNISIFNIEIILGTGKYQEVKRDCIAANGVNNLGISITKQDAQNHLNKDCLELKQDEEVVCFCDTDLCNVGNIISSKIIFIAIIAVICLLIIWWIHNQNNEGKMILILFLNI